MIFFSFLKFALLQFLDVGARPGPLMRCRCCPGLDLLPIRCRGQRGTGAAPPSVSGGQKLHCAGCGRCQLSSFTRPLHCKGSEYDGADSADALSPALGLRSPNYAAFLSYFVAASSPAPFLHLERY